MKKYVIEGGQKLKGTVKVSGSKNAALPILAATLLTNEDIILKNVPVQRDIHTMISLLAMLGKRVIAEPHRMIITDTGKGKHKATYEIVKQMRASIVVLGPLLARYKKAVVSLPGGCAFGPRPIDLHLRGMEELGAKIKLVKGDINAKASKLIGKEMDLSGEFGPSVLATDNVMMAGTLAKGTTIIDNAAREPETQDLANFLNKMGAKISGAGSSKIEIEGVTKLHGCEYEVISDRIEAATYACAAAITGGNVKIEYPHEDHVEAMVEVLKSIGVGVQFKNGIFHVKGKSADKYKGFRISTRPHPHFPTDMQPLFMALGSIINENSTVTEGIYPNRYGHAMELRRLGADIDIEQETAIIKPCEGLEGASVQAGDLRAGAALVIAGLAAKGNTEVRRIYHVERGYEKMVEKLTSLGAKIKLDDDSII